MEWPFFSRREGLTSWFYHLCHRVQVQGDCQRIVDVLSGSSLLLAPETGIGFDQPCHLTFVSKHRKTSSVVILARRTYSCIRIPSSFS